MFNNLVVQPFALTDAELKDIEAFANKNELHSIARLCAELRALRSAYTTLSYRRGKEAANATPIA